MKSREFVPLEGRPGHPYIESGGQVTYRERGSLDRVVVSLQGRSSCPGVSARSGTVVVMVLLPCRGMAGVMLQCQSMEPAEPIDKARQAYPSATTRRIHVRRRRWCCSG